jgi:hypothetical protein
MTDGNEANRRYHARIQQEHAELDHPVVKAQMQLDRWWQAQRDFEDELDDDYMVGGFMERWSQTPSFSKSKRDRDWKVR